MSENNNEEINIQDIFKILKKRIKLIIVITLLFSVTSGIITFFIIEPKYKSEASLFIGKDNGNIGETIDEIDTYITYMLTYAEIVKTKSVIESAIKNANLDINAEQVLSKLEVLPRGETQIMEIKYTDTDRLRAFDVVSAITNEFIMRAKTMMPKGNLQVLEPPEILNSPSSPNKKLNLLIGTILGVMIAVGIVFLLEFLNNCYKDKDDIEEDFGIAVIGEIPIINEKKFVKNKKKAKRKLKKNSRWK